MLPVSYLNAEACAQDGELVLLPGRGNIVSWVRYGRDYRTFAMEQPVVAAVFAYFTKCSDNDEKWVVIACEDMSVHSYNLTSGESRVLGLNFRPKAMNACGKLGVAFSYYQNNHKSLDLALMEGPQVLPKAIVPSSLCAPLKAADDLKMISERYMLTWNKDLKMMTLFAINILPPQKIDSFGGLNYTGSSGSGSARQQLSSEGSDYSKPLPFFESQDFGGAVGKGAVFSQVCEWTQKSSGTVFTQNWGFMESIVSHDPVAQEAFVFNANEVFAFEGVAHVSPIRGICGFPAVIQLLNSGSMSVAFYSRSDSGCVDLDLDELIDVKNVAKLKSEPNSNWCEVVYTDSREPTQFCVDLDYEDQIKRCIDIICEIQGPLVASQNIPLMIGNTSSHGQWGSILEFLERFIVQTENTKVGSQLIIYLHMLCEELRLSAADNQADRILSDFIAPYVQNWGEEWVSLYPTEFQDKNEDEEIMEDHVEQNQNVDASRISAGNNSATSTNSEQEQNLIKLPCLLESPPNVFETMIFYLDPIEGNTVSTEFANFPHLFPISSALVGLFHEAATQKSTERIREYLMMSGILPHLDRLTPGIRVCILEMCSLVGIDDADSNAINQKDNKDNFQWQPNHEIAAALFNADLRYKECQRLLQVNEPQKCLLGIFLDGNDDKFDMGIILDTWSSALASRALASGYGKAAVELGSKRPMLWEQMEPIDINFEGECTETGINIPPHYDSLAKAAAEDAWGVFSHGVALGLSVCSQSPGIDSLWVVSSARLREESSELYSGFVYGMGLSGHLSSLEDWQFYESLVNSNIAGTIAALVGVAASKKGSRDTKLTKVLAVHIRALLPEGAARQNSMVPCQVERAALISLGLLYFGQGVRHLTDVLLRELCSLPSGIVGENSIGEHSQVGEKRTRSVNSVSDGEGSENNFSLNLATGITLGLINHGKGEAGGLNSLLDHVCTHYDRSVDGAEIENGALLALLLTYCGSNNKLAADRIKLPVTQSALRYSTPSTIFLRALVHHLIKWDEVEPTQVWIENQIPTVIGDLISKPSSTISKVYYYYALTGVLIAMAMRYCGTGNEQVIDILIYYTRDVIGRAYRETYEKIRASRKLVDPTSDDRYNIPYYVIDYTLLNMAQNLAHLLSSLALSMSAVASGTGNLKVLRLLRELYQVGPQLQAWLDVDMAHNLDADHSLPHISQAIGWLFLAEGTCSFKTDPQSVSMLACFSFLSLSGGPNINTKEWDYLSFFWALVTEKRCLFIRGSPTKEVKAEVHLKNGEVLACETPYHLPPLSSISHINITDENYVPQTINDCEAVVSGDSPGVKLVARKSAGGTLSAVLERKKKGIDSAVLHDTWESSQLEMLKATLRTMARNPSEITQEWDIKLLLTFYEMWPEDNENRILKKQDTEELRLLRWLYYNQINI